MEAGIRLWAALAGLALAVLMWGGVAQAANPEDHPVVKAQIYAQETWPDEFAGFWLDFDYPRTNKHQGGIPSDQKVFIAFTDDAEEKVAELRQKFPASNPYVAVTHTHSMVELERLQQKVTNDLRAYMDGRLAIPGPAFKWHGTGIWVVDNVVEVNLSAVTPEYEAWAADRYGSDYAALKIFVGDEVVPDSGLVGHVHYPGKNANKQCNARCHRTKARKKALRKKCARASRRAKKTGSRKARKIARSKKCRAVRRG